MGTSAGSARPSPKPSGKPARWKPAVGSRWQYQLSGNPAFRATGGVNVDICVRPHAGGACARPQVFDIDLYADGSVAGNNSTLNTAAVKAIHARGGKAICYLDAGSVEKGRPDYQQYVDWHNSHGRSLIGKAYPGFPDENFANINNDRGQRDFVLRMQEARVRKCAQAGFDGVEFDVVNAHEEKPQTTGWSVTPSTQLVFNRALADMAHRHGMAAGLKNNLRQIPELLSSFDFAINEECWEYRECGLLKPFIRAGKPVFGVEYNPSRSAGDPLGFCREAAAMRFSTIKKGEDYALKDKPYTPCR
ncbi:endo alpha-1,4 polygalactosaminidase [Actinomadura macra]|uniref:endo alpha-1,4 polygalactosaminidase n=1 Tax=Actinomadura macra TaxID=46164 RepID=UPI00082C6232|nr:endo alpha-1,4 polygalactosaminidase [Actinomadura macra]